MKKLKIIAALSVGLLLSGCDTLNKVATSALQEYLEGQTLSSLDAINGLKQTLNFGTEDAVRLLTQENGFYNSELLKIPFPDELKTVEQTLNRFGLENLTDAFIKELNKGAEKAVSKATPIFKHAIETMTFEDAMGILLGNERAATDYFERKTRATLYAEFKPEVLGVLDQYGITKGYKELMSAYNTIPFVKSANTDLPDYVTNKTLDGLFYKISLEEQNMRTNVSARKTQLLQKVFGYADAQKTNTQ